MAETFGKDRTVIVSADDYFMKPDPANLSRKIYTFDPSLLSMAHAKCMENFLIALTITDIVIVDNTNVQRWEFENYRLAGILAGYSVSVLSAHGPAKNLTIQDLRFFTNRNTHGVPFAAICAMAQRWEE